MLYQTTIIALMIISMEVLFALGAFQKIRKQQSVPVKDILSIEETSVTRCHLKCRSTSECVGYGSHKMGMGEKLINCHLLKRIIHNLEADANDDKHILLDVVGMVRFEYLLIFGYNIVRWEGIRFL